MTDLWIVINEERSKEVKSKEETLITFFTHMEKLGFNCKTDV